MNNCVVGEADAKELDSISTGISMPPSNQAILQVSYITNQITNSLIKYSKKCCTVCNQMRTMVVICSTCDDIICVATTVDMHACLPQAAGEDYNSLPEEWQCFHCVVHRDGYWPVSNGMEIEIVCIH